MKIGQTSLVVFISKFTGSALGFVATVYFARVLGAEVLGVYALVLTTVSWLTFVGDKGIGKALSKRLSEGDQQGTYLSAAVLSLVGLGMFLTLGVAVASPLVEYYIDEFERYSSISVVWFVIAIIWTQLLYRAAIWILRGERKVYVAGLLNPVSVTSKRLVQLLLVLLGWQLVGMLVGFAVGGLFVGILALYWVSIRPRLPSREHFESLFGYAKFSWLGGLKSRTFNEVDILLLGVFVPSSLVGVYSVSWSIAKFLDLFGNAVNQTMFPEISHTDATGADQTVSGLVEDALAFSGLVAIPGLVGGAILAERLLRIYGEEFVSGAAVLGLLVLAVLLHSYQLQLLNALNGLNRPDLAFRINGVFIAVNATLNLALIWRYGIEGAAAATVFSAALALGLAYYALSTILVFQVPLGEISRQAFAALVMGGIVWSTLTVADGVVGHNLALVLGLVILGAGVYFVTLLVVSVRFRDTVERNLPVRVPLLS